MKPLQILIVLVILILTPIMNYAQSNPDTVIVNFGNSSKMVFYINEKGDLEQLKSYDLNALVSDMKDKIEADTVASTEEDGEQYLKDSVFTTNDVGVDSVDNYSYNNDENENDDRWSNRYDDHDKGDRDYYEWRNRGDRNIVINNRLGSNHFINFDFGINNYFEDDKSPSSNNAQYTVKPWGSWYFAINSVHRSHVTGKLSLEWGAGISWYNFKFEDASTRLVKSDTDLQFVSSSVGDSFKKSKLTASYVNVNLVPVLDFGSGRKKGFRIGIGGYGGYRLGSHAKYRYKLDGSSEKDKDKDNFYLSNWRYGARLQLGFKGTDIFVNYDLNDLFSEGRAPKLNAFSFGITI